MQTTIRPLSELSETEQINPTNNTITPLMRGNVYALATGSGSVHNQCTYTDESSRISLIQHGFCLTGVCTVQSGHQAVLVASVGEQIVGLVDLGSFESKPDNRDQINSIVNANFTMQLDATLLANSIEQSIQFTLLNDEKLPLIELLVSEVMVNAMGNDFDIVSIAPSYGFFGGGRSEPLAIEICKEIRSLTLTVDEKKAFLNIRELTLFDAEDKPISLDGITVSCSSTKHSDPHSDKLLQGEGFHSECEDSPWFTITFDTPRFIKQVKVANRKDKWGSRSQKLRMSFVDEHHAQSDIYAPFSQLAIARFLVRVVDFTGFKLFNIDNKNARREYLLDSFLTALNAEQLDHEHLFFVLSFISTWAEKQATPSLHQKELKLLAAYVHSRTANRFGFSLLPFARVLAYASDLEFVEQEVNRLRAINSQELVKFTKHGFARQGMLVQNKAEVLDTLETVMEDLSNLGLRPCLAYGTLLGAHREKQFIAHDDDVDILVEFVEKNMTREQAYARRDELMKQLDPDKYRINSASKTLKNFNIHVFSKKNNIMIDVFPYWHQGENVLLHMEKMAVRAIPGSILADRQEIELEGRTFPAPGNVEAFLVERYGESWHVSDKYHEWQWPIKTQLMDKQTQ